MTSISIYQKTDAGEAVLLEFNIISEFWFNTTLFLIINPIFSQFNCSDNSNLTKVQENPYYTIFDQINIDSNNYLVVKPKEQLLKAVCSPKELLSQRELQIVELVAQGKSNKQIATKLKISEWTVSTHLRRIFIKLDVDSRAAMVYRCAGLIRYRVHIQ